jgi:hypothetical protein
MREKKNTDIRNNADLLRQCAPLREDIKKLLKKAAKKSSAKNREQFLADVMTGNCPQCGSNRTQNGDAVEGIEDLTIGRCLSCGHLWCSECGHPLGTGSQCIHWDICKKCKEADESGSCGIILSECHKLKE